MVTPDEIKDNIIKWCKEDNLSCKVLPDSKNLWAIQISNLIVYCQKNLPDRVYFQQELRLAGKEKELVKNLDNTKKAALIFTLNRNSVEFDYHHTLLNEKDGQIFTGVSMYQFTSTNMSKDDFLRIFLRVQKIGNYTNNFLSNFLGVEMNLKKMQEKSDSDSTNLAIG